MTDFKAILYNKCSGIRLHLFLDSGDKSLYIKFSVDSGGKSYYIRQQWIPQSLYRNPGSYNRENRGHNLRAYHVLKTHQKISRIYSRSDNAQIWQHKYFLSREPFLFEFILGLTFLQFHFYERLLTFDEAVWVVTVKNVGVTEGEFVVVRG